MSPVDIAKIAREYVEKNRGNLYKESRDHATSWHAHILCHGCGSCIRTGIRSLYCPDRLGVDQMALLDNLTWGPARNIISFTGGDLAGQPEFYIEATRGIKNSEGDLWVLFETNGYGLTPTNIDLFRDAGLDSFWLDIKAYDDDVHRSLTGASNKRVLQIPSELAERGFTIEVSSVYIPGWVETDQLGKIAELIAQVDASIPYSIIAFFPENKLKNVPSPVYAQMVQAFEAARDAGLKNVKVGNLGRFVRYMNEYDQLHKMGAI